MSRGDRGGGWRSLDLRGFWSEGKIVPSKEYVYLGVNGQEG